MDIRKQTPAGERYASEHNLRLLRNKDAFIEASLCGETVVARPHRYVLDSHYEIMCCGQVCYATYKDIDIRAGHDEKFDPVRALNKAMDFRILSICQDGPFFARLSRTALQEEQYDIIFDGGLGQVLYGRAIKFAAKGAFFELGWGLTGYLPNKLASTIVGGIPEHVMRLKHIYPLVLRGICKTHIQLSYRELLGTWEENSAKVKRGSEYLGVVRHLSQQHVFIELFTNLGAWAPNSGNLRLGQVVKALITDKLESQADIRARITGQLETTWQVSEEIIQPKSSHILQWEYTSAPISEHRRLRLAFGSLCHYKS